MSRTIDLFLDSDQPLDRLAARLADLTGVRLEACPDRSRFVMQEGMVTAHLAEHHFLDDEGLPLSEFRYALSTAVRAHVAIEESPELACMRRLNASLRSAGGITSLLVVDLERPDWATSETGPASLGEPQPGEEPGPRRAGA